MAQFEPLCSRHGMLAGSFLKLVGVTVGGGVEVVEGGIGICLGVEGGDGGVDRGINELEGLVLVVAGRAGPITCRKCINRGVSETQTRPRRMPVDSNELSTRVCGTIHYMYSPVDSNELYYMSFMLMCV